tara:strand:+ start:627 stop:809 length:183 start_codon:yes stop_codon:yes gene_type:complete
MSGHLDQDPIDAYTTTADQEYLNWKEFEFVSLESQVETMLDHGASNRETALRWIKDAEEA